MKKFFLLLPLTRAKVIVTVDDEDAYRLRSENWRVKRSKRSLDVYRIVCGVHLMLGREILNITEDYVCVEHKNGDATDFRRNNLVSVSQKEHMLNARSVTKRALGVNTGYCVRGHALTPDNIADNGYNGACRICHKAAAKRRYQKEKRGNEFMSEA